MKLAVLVGRECTLRRPGDKGCRGVGKGQIVVWVWFLVVGKK